MDKISVIVPVSNSQKYLTQCLDSIIYQTYCELEIILVNDFSIDESEKIILEYQKKDKRINFIKNHKTKGAALAKNSALEISKGKYVFFLEACDFLDINAIKNAYFEIKDSNSDIVITKTKYPASNDMLFGFDTTKNEFYKKTYMAPSRYGTFTKLKDGTYLYTGGSGGGFSPKKKAYIFK